MAIETNFFLRNVNDTVDARLFKLLESHYGRLGLFRRFSDGADTVISSLRNIMEPLKMLHNISLAKQIGFDYVKREREAFGYNYWQSILRLELLNNEDFMIDYE